MNWWSWKGPAIEPRFNFLAKYSTTTWPWARADGVFLTVENRLPPSNQLWNHFLIPSKLNPLGLRNIKNFSLASQAEYIIGVTMQGGLKWTCFDEKVRSRQILLYSEQNTRSVLKFLPRKSSGQSLKCRLFITKNHILTRLTFFGGGEKR